MIEPSVLLIVFIGFLSHEVFLMNYFITYGIENGLTLPVFIGLFIITDVVAIPSVYFFYNFLYNKLSKKPLLIKKLDRMSNKLGRYAKDYGGILGLMLLGFLGNIWLATLLSVFLRFKMKDAFIGLVIGSLFFFLILYSNVTGMMKLIPKFPGSTFVIVILVFIFATLIRLIVKKLIEKRKG